MAARNPRGQERAKGQKVELLDTAANHKTHTVNPRIGAPTPRISAPFKISVPPIDQTLK